MLEINKVHNMNALYPKGYNITGIKNKEYKKRSDEQWQQALNGLNSK